MTKRELEDLERRARLAEGRADAEGRIALADAYNERMRGYHRNFMERHYSDIQSSPASYSTQERQAAERHFAQRQAAIEDERRFRQQRDMANIEWDAKREMAKTEAGWRLGSAEATAGAERHKADRDYAGIEAKARADAEAMKGRMAFEERLAGRKFDHENAMGEREWGARERIAKEDRAQRAESERERIASEREIAEEKAKAGVDAAKARADGAVSAAEARNPKPGMRYRDKDGNWYEYSGTLGKWMMVKE